MTIRAAVPSPLFSATKLSESIRTSSQTGLTLFALEAFQQAGFFAANVSAGTAVQIDLVIIAGAAGILADQAGVIRLLNRGLEVLRLVIEFTADIDVAGACAHPDTGQQ